jgi:hypothetical protein
MTNTNETPKKKKVFQRKEIIFHTQKQLRFYFLRRMAKNNRRLKMNLKSITPSLSTS